MSEIKISYNIKEFILMTLLFEIGRDKVITDQEKIYFKNLSSFLSIKEEDFFNIKAKVKLSLQDYTDNKAFSPQDFFSQIYGRLQEELNTSESNLIIQTLHSKMKCENTYPKSSLLKDFKITNSPKTLKTFQNDELQSLLLEISEKDWEDELTKFQEQIIDRKVSDDTSVIIKQEEQTGLKPGAIAGFCLSLLTCILVSGISDLATLVLAFIFSMVFSIAGAGIGVIVKRYILNKDYLSISTPIRNQYESYAMTASELLSFWDSRVELYLHYKKEFLADKIKQAAQTTGECRKVLYDLYELEGFDPLVETKLKEQITQMSVVSEEASQMNQIIQKVEDQMMKKVYELKAMIQKEKLLEKKQYEREALASRVNQVLGKSEKINAAWNEEKTELKSQISGMMTVFQKQILHTKDLVLAEIELK
ncbi:MAG: hypothetical protein KC646_16020 [Candidatus Cloacimonetes bacterium]|nr:hypothetical protein [Candidatus Cloacimonadota bacterium]